MDQTPLERGIAEDRVLGARIRLLQATGGYRAGLDAALLAAACDARPGERVLDAGCGVGGALLAAAWRRPESRFLGLERDAQAAELARRNVLLNEMQARVRIVEGDIGKGFRALGLGVFDCAISNPPFFDDPSQLRGPAPERAGAYLAEAGISGWCEFLTRSVREGGRIILVHRADRLADILAALAPKAGSIQIRPVQPFADEPAKRVLVRAVKTGKAPLILLPALVLHERGGAKHAPQAEAILRGEAAVEWR